MRSGRKFSFFRLLHVLIDFLTIKPRSLLHFRTSLDLIAVLGNRQPKSCGSCIIVKFLASVSGSFQHGASVCGEDKRTSDMAFWRTPSTLLFFYLSAHARYSSSHEEISRILWIGAWPERARGDVSFDVNVWLWCMWRECRALCVSAQMVKPPAEAISK